MRELWLLAGINGAGKTTASSLFVNLQEDVSFVNPDNICFERLLQLGYRRYDEAPLPLLRELYGEVATNVQTELEELIAAPDQSFRVGIETVLSTGKYLPAIADLRATGGKFFLVYVAVSSVEIAIDRVKHREALGRHGVPEEKMRERWRRTLEFLPEFARLAERFWVFDNSGSNPELIAMGERGIGAILRPGINPAIEQALSPLLVQS